MEQKQALAERLKQANNILVTVSSNPSVDQLAACIGMTLALNKMNKHATAVFSGAIPNIIAFLEPEKTIEKNTDSLRDFIIALDKSKADKLRYKVEDTVVKIFITPYKTSINEKDLQFSQGDFNVDVVLALGVHNQADLDQAITAHGRILHDATVATVNVEPGGELGTVNWVDHVASSLSELTSELVDAIDKEILDTQIATAFLTGIVAETDRFSNDKTSPMTMTISAELMAAGANQQLVATKLEPPAPEPAPAPAPAEASHEGDQEKHADSESAAPPAEPPKPDDGTLEISHVGEQRDEPQSEPDHTSAKEEPAVEPTPETANDAPKAPSEIQNEPSKPALEPKPEEPAAELVASKESTPELDKPDAAPEASVPQIKIDEQGSLQMHDGDTLPEPGPKPEIHMEKQHMILQPPTLSNVPMTGGMLPEDEERPAGAPPLSAAPTPGLLQRGPSMAAASFPPVPSPFQPSAPAPLVMPNAPFGAPTPVSQSPAPVIPPAPPVIMTPVAPLPPTSPAPPVFQPAPFSTPPAPSVNPFAAPNQAIAPAPIPNPAASQTLSDIERNVGSPHLQQFMPPTPPAPVMPAPAPMAPPPAAMPAAPPTPYNPPPAAPLPPAPVVPPAAPGADLASARDAVMHAYEGMDQNDPIQALNAQPLGTPLHENQPSPNAAPQDLSAPPSLPPPIMPTPGA